MKKRVIIIIIVALLVLTLGAFCCYLLSFLTIESSGKKLLGEINSKENIIEFTCPRGDSFSLLLGGHDEKDFEGCRGVVQIYKNNSLIKVFSFDANTSVHANWLYKHKLKSRIITYIKEKDYLYKKINLPR